MSELDPPGTPLPPAAPPPGPPPIPPPAAPPTPGYAYGTPPPLPPPVPSYAGFWVRFVAAVIDGFVLFFLGAATHAVIRLAAGAPLMPLWRDARGAGMGLACGENFVELIVWWLYSALLESSSSQATLGKMALGMKVTDMSGRRIDFGRATGRTFAKILSAIPLFVGYMMAGFTQRRQALHDMIAGTVVLRFR
ncbi:MAG: RDD family protein [Acidobacteriota bacterium]